MAPADPPPSASELIRRRHAKLEALRAAGIEEAGESLRQVQDAAIQRTLWETGGDVAGAARRLGVAKTTIYRRLKRASGIRPGPGAGS